MNFPPIAIVGQGCVLPGALHPHQLWEAVLAGRDLLGPVPEGYWRLPASEVLTSPEAWTPGKTWSDRGGYVRGFEEVFDASGFALPAEQIRTLDAQLHWVLYAAREALGGTQPLLPQLARLRQRGSRSSTPPPAVSPTRQRGSRSLAGASG